jgi:hypothetical protein
LSGRDPNEDDPTIVYMARYLHTLDNHYDDLFLHCTHLNSWVESLEQQIKGLKEEKASLQESLEIAEGEEANTREAYRTLKMDYAKKLKKLAPTKKIRKWTKSQGCQTDRKEEAPPTLPPSRIESLSNVEEMSLCNIPKKMLPKVYLRCVDVGKELWAVGCKVKRHLRRRFFFPQNPSGCPLFFPFLGRQPPRLAPPGAPLPLPLAATLHYFLLSLDLPHAARIEKRRSKMD